MARTVVTYNGTSISALQATVNAQLALLPGIIMRNAQLLVPGDLRNLNNAAWGFILTYDTGGTGTQPFAVLLSPGTEESVAVAASQTFITANPTYFFAPILVTNWTQGGRQTQHYFSMLVYNTNAATGGANYADFGPGTGVEVTSGTSYQQAANTAATAVTGLSFAVATYQGLVVDYVLTRGAGVSKTGQLVVNGDSAAPTITDSTQGAVTGAPGITWTVTVSTGVVTVKLAVDNTIPGVGIRFLGQVQALLAP